MFVRKTFYYPALRMLKNGDWRWLTNQGLKYLTIKYLNRLWPNKILFGPVMGVIVITYRCNSRCPMCDLSARGKASQELSLKKMEALIDDFAVIGSSGLSFTGGEPLLRKDIYHLIKYANKKGMVTTLNTNALLLNKKKIKQLVEACPNNTNISLDAADASGYDKLRGTKNGLAKLKKIVPLLIKQRNKKNAPMTFTAVSTISPGNINQVKEIAQLTKEMGFDKLGFNPIHSVGKTVSTYSKKLTNEDVYQKMTDVKKDGVILDNTDKFLRMFQTAFSGRPFPLRCLAGYTSLFVDCFGDVFFCLNDLELGKNIANIKKEKLKDIWFSNKYEKKRKIMNKCRGCFWNCQAELSIMFQ